MSFLVMEEVMKAHRAQLEALVEASFPRRRLLAESERLISQATEAANKAGRAPVEKAVEAYLPSPALFADRLVSQMIEPARKACKASRAQVEAALKAVKDSLLGPPILETPRPEAPQSRDTEDGVVDSHHRLF